MLTEYVEAVCYCPLFLFDDHCPRAGRNHSVTIPLDMGGQPVLDSQYFG